MQIKKGLKHTMTRMTDTELIGYCAIHCETPRALFNGDQINRMIALAGYPKDFPREIEPNRCVSVHDEMSELCKLARERIKLNAMTPIPNNIIPFPKGANSHA